MSVISLASLASLKTQMSISGTGDDGRLVDLLGAATGMIANECRRDFVRQTDIVEYFDSVKNLRTGYAYGSSDLDGRTRYATPVNFYVSRYPMETLSVWHSPTRSYTDQALLVDDTDYTHDLTTGKITVLHGMTGRYHRAVKVQYTAGYAAVAGTEAGVSYSHMQAALEAAGAYDLVYACRAQAASMYDREETGSFGVTTRSGGGEDDGAERTSSAVILPEVQQMIAPYRRLIAR